MVEGHVRGLATLGKSPDCYGTLLTPIIIGTLLTPIIIGKLLTPIILGKLLKEIRKNLARERNNIKWMLDDLRSTLLREIQILETGIHASGSSNHIDYSDLQPMTMASLYTGARRNPQPLSDAKKYITCVYIL